MSYDDMADMLSYVLQHRTSDSPFEFVAGNNDAPGRSLDDLAALGVTWLFYNLWDVDPESTAKVHRGPWRSLRCDDRGAAQTLSSY